MSCSASACSLLSCLYTPLGTHLLYEVYNETVKACLHFFQIYFSPIRCVGEGLCRVTPNKGDLCSVSIVFSFLESSLPLETCHFRHFVWVGHLVGPIIGVFALLGGDFALSYIDTFFAYPNIGWVFLNIGGGYSNIGGVYSNKTRQFKTIFCASQHARMRNSLFFDHKTRILNTFATFSLFHLIPNRQRECFAPLASRLLDAKKCRLNVQHALAIRYTTAQGE